MCVSAWKCEWEYVCACGCMEEVHTCLIVARSPPRLQGSEESDNVTCPHTDQENGEPEILVVGVSDFVKMYEWEG